MDRLRIILMRWISIRVYPWYYLCHMVLPLLSPQVLGNDRGQGGIQCLRAL